jgi:HSP20 family protein
MAIPSLWNPLRTMNRLDPNGDFDELFRGLGMRPWHAESELAPELRMDVSEDDKAYTVSMDTPGARKEDIDITVEGNRITVSVEVKREREHKEGTKSLHSERYVGRSYRSFSLPSDIDEAHTQARYEHGTLTLTLPKKTGSASHRINVQ